MGEDDKKVLGSPKSLFSLEGKAGIIFNIFVLWTLGEDALFANKHTFHDVLPPNFLNGSQVSEAPRL